MKPSIHLTEEEIALSAEAMIAGDLSHLEPRVREHLDHCTQCAGEVMMVAEVSGEVPEITSASVQTKPLWGYVALLAAAVVVIVMIINVPGWFKPASNHSPEMAGVVQDSINPTANQPDQYPEKPMAIEDKTTSKSQKSEQNSQTNSTLGEDALAYAPNEALENLVSQYLTAYRSDETVEVRSKAELQFPENDSLTWKNPDNISLTLEWYNNRGVLIQTVKTQQNGAPIPPFENGLYYWKLMNEDFDLLVVGKVRVRGGA